MFVQHRTSGPICIKGFRSADLSLIILPIQEVFSFLMSKPVNLDQNCFQKPDDMSPSHFSHHGSLQAKADDFVGYLSNCTEEAAHSLAMCQKSSYVQSYTTSNKSNNSSSLCTMDTSHGWLLILDIRAMTACVRKMDVDIHPVGPRNGEGEGQLAPNSSTPMPLKPPNTVAISDAVGDRDQ